jgi:bifunctional DNA-binding transcriptional regulator/antitoxin component of YhaV-PrlF toxin-antitoxin module
MSSKGQFTMPADIREFLKMQKGSVIKFIKKSNTISLEVEPSFSEKLDAFHAKHPTKQIVMTDDELQIAIREAVTAGAVARYNRCQRGLGLPELK